MKTLKLDVNERLLIVNVLSGVRGNVSVLRQAIKVIDIVDLSEKERNKINLRREKDMLRWDDEKGVKKTFDFEDAEFIFLKEKMSTKTDYPVDKRIVVFLDKLETI